MKRALVIIVWLLMLSGVAPAEEKPLVVFETNLGEIRVELYPEQAPVTVENFLAYVDAGFYDGTLIHRVIPGFVVQGGGFTKDFERRDTRAPIVNEADNGLRNERGTLSMARTQARDSATSQFFINLRDNQVLDHGERDFGYAVFARVVEGMDVVDEMATRATTRVGPMSDVPADPIVIEKARRVSDN